MAGFVEQLDLDITRALQQVGQVESRLTQAGQQFRVALARSLDELTQKAYAILFSSRDVSSNTLAETLSISHNDIPLVLMNLNDLLQRTSPLTVSEVGNVINLLTRPEYADIIKAANGPALQQAKLSNAALEVLAIIAYNQPAKKDLIDSTRGGTDSEKVLDTLLRKGLIRATRRFDQPGAPSMYHTTDAFLKYFHLKSVFDLPSMDVIKNMTD